MTTDDIIKISNGNHFFRADLHIHSFGSSHDVTDTTMTVKGILVKAIEERLDVIAITDHNEITNVESAVGAAEQSILVIPGVELSTPQGHLLCYLPTIESLRSFHGHLRLADRGTPNSRCQTSMLACLELLADFEGIGVLAHVDGDGGFEKKNPGNSPHKLDVLCHKSLLGIELHDINSASIYSDSDPNSCGVSVARERIRRLRLGSRQFLASCRNSDAHTLNRIGRDPRGEDNVTRIKMDTPTFTAFKVALQESDSRVRLEDQIPKTVPHVTGIHFDGGFIDNQTIHFSPNLNCIIGGRGTGKSTTFEAVRCLDGRKHDSDVVDSEVWPSLISYVWHDRAGQLHEVKREIYGTLENVNDPFSGPSSFRIESYGQGETARISRESQTDPTALLSYLDRFVDIAEPSNDEAEACVQLMELEKQISHAITNVDRIPEVKRALAHTRQQLKALEQANAVEIIDLQRKIATERKSRDDVCEKVNALASHLDSIYPQHIFDALKAVSAASLAFGHGDYKNILQDAQQFEDSIQEVQSQLKEKFKEFKHKVNVNVVSWNTKSLVAQQRVDDKRRELTEQKIPLDMTFIRKLAEDEAKYVQEITRLQTQQQELKGLIRQHKELSRRRWAARAKVANIRQAFARQATSTLESSLSDLRVSLKFSASTHSPDAEQLIATAMEWRTSQVPKASLLVAQLTMEGLLKAVDNKDIATICNVKNTGGVTAFTKAEASAIVAHLSDASIRYKLESFEVYDIPRLTVTKEQRLASGDIRPVQRDFSKLSLGQQQSVLLALVLSSNNDAPLIIDQPEDNLDGEFIYKSLVPVLRRAKERRQIIVITHNANIAVLGDAEQVVVLRSTAEHGMISSRGSIDDLKTRDEACNILEGAREAFEHRARIYGLSGW